MRYIDRGKTRLAKWYAPYSVSLPQEETEGIDVEYISMGALAN